jgi:nucleotide-binding universal stress UspA family protein
MQKHLLLTISDDPSALYGVRFVNGFFQNKDEIKFTLLYIEPRTVQHTELAPPREEESHTCDLALESAMSGLMNAGFEQEHVFCKVKKRMVSKAKDIISEGNKGLYDAVVLGRRGISRLEELINDSVSIQVLEASRKAPIWVCRHTEPDRRNVLVCVDGSEESLRMVDHAGFFLADEDAHSLTMFQVNQGEAEPESVFRQARERLQEHAIPKSRITEKTVEASNAAAAIEAEAKAGAYSAVAVGYAGKGRRGLISIGSTATKLVYSMTGSALWIG